MIGFNRVLLKAALAAFAAVVAQPAGAQGVAGYPDKPIHLIGWSGRNFRRTSDSR